MLRCFSISCLALGAACVASCGNAPDTALSFNQPAEEALNRLDSDDRIVEGTGMGSLTIAPGETNDDTITITIRRAGGRAVPCRVKVSAVSEASSRAAIDCTQPSTGSAAQGVATQAITLVIREHVAAAIEDRPYDIEGVANGMLVLVAANGPRLAAAMHSDAGQADNAN